MARAPTRQPPPRRPTKGSVKKPATRPKRPVRAARPARPVRTVRQTRQAQAPRQTASVDPTLFAPLSPGERADALRVLLEDSRLRAMAKVGRYRVLTVEPLVTKPPEESAGRRLARAQIYDYAGDRCIDACVDLEASAVTGLNITAAQPMLSPEEESEAVALALADERLAAAPVVPHAVLHYWSRRPTDLAYRRRSAAVIVGPAGGAPSFVAVVDIVDHSVVEVVPASQW